MYNCFTPFVSFCCFHPALHVPLGVRVDMASRWGGTLCTVVPAPGDARPTVMDRRLQVFFFGPSGRNGAGLCWGAGSVSASASAASSSTAALAGALNLEGSDKFRVHCYEICCEPLDRGRELCNGGAIARRGCRQVHDSIHRLLLEVPVVRVCGGIVCGALGGTGLVSNKEAPLPVCGCEKHLEMWERLVVHRSLFPFPKIRRENSRVEDELVRVVLNLLA